MFNRVQKGIVNIWVKRLYLGQKEEDFLQFNALQNLYDIMKTDHRKCYGNGNQHNPTIKLGLYNKIFPYP
jgi:hypothetical protein